MRKTKFDDGFQAYLTEGATLVGAPGIPMLMNLDNVQIPKDIVPFNKARTCANKRQYVHFYLHDKQFSQVLTATKKYLEVLNVRRHIRVGANRILFSVNSPIRSCRIGSRRTILAGQPHIVVVLFERQKCCL